MKRRKHAFTLVELLVVIGIIALLISILLPSLNRVRWQAKVVACSARMHDLLLSVTMYANDNKGFLPPYPGDTGLSTFNLNSFASQFATTYQEAFSSATVFAATDDGANIGRLWRTKYLKSTKTFYCPDAKFEPPTVNARFFSNYTLNPHYKYTDAAGTILQVWWKRLPGYGKIASPTMTYVDQQTFTPATKTVPTWTRAILAEPFFASSASDVSNISHTVGNRRAFNFGYPDGSVRTWTDDKWASRVVDRWVRFLDISNSLQHAIDGGAVNFRGNWQNNLYNAIPVQPN